MTLTIPADLEEFVQREIATGRYQTAEEVVRAGIMLLQERERQRDRLRDDIDAAIQQIENGEYVEYDQDSLRGFFEELKQSARDSHAKAQ